MINCECCYIDLAYQRVVLENKSSMYLQLLEPEIVGSGIIIPKPHRETVFDLTEEEWNDTYLLLKKIKKQIDEEFKPDGYNIGWNSGAVGGQHIFHAHLQVIPQAKGLGTCLRVKRIKGNRTADILASGRLKEFET